MVKDSYRLAFCSGKILSLGKDATSRVGVDVSKATVPGDVSRAAAALQLCPFPAWDSCQVKSCWENPRGRGDCGLEHVFVDG